jgi:hypothetical protein
MMNPALATVLEVLGILMRFVGLIVLGLGTGWMAADAYRKGMWQLQIAAVLGFFALVAVFVRFATAGALGAFALGSGIGVLVWGLRARGETQEDTPQG